MAALRHKQPIKNGRLCEDTPIGSDELRRLPRGPAALDGSSERVGRVSPDISSRYREPFAQKDRLKNRFSLAFSNGESG
jgi:hypothetical protein